MQLTEYGKLVRKGRIEANCTMSQMAFELGVAASYLSAIESGKKRVPVPFVDRVVAYFHAKGIEISRLHEAAFVANKQVPIDGLPIEQQYFIAQLARVNLSVNHIDSLTELLTNLRKMGNLGS